MKRPHLIVIAVVALLLAGGGYELWQVLFHKVWRGEPHHSEAQRKNPMLAATRLLAAHGHQVRIEPMLTHPLLQQLPDGVMMLSPWAGQPDERQARVLLDWVRRGNTLVMTPGWVQNTDAKSNSQSALSARLADPLGKHFGVSMADRSRIDDTCRIDPLAAEMRAKIAKQAAEAGEEEEEQSEPAPAPRLVCLNAPGAAHTIELRRQSDVLQRFDGKGPKPLWGDTYGLAVLVYGEGRGKVAMLAAEPRGGYFDNSALRQFDHGELLLLLAAQSGAKAPVLLVQDNQHMDWAEYLWHHWRPVVLGLAALLLLWTWNASRRFGPLLPGEALPRRALIEHIDASGRWLWRLPQGRALLLDAVRRRTEKLLQRRLPELQALAGPEHARRLARLAKLPEAHVMDAMHGAAGARAADFTRQISILQRLRAPYER